MNSQYHQINCLIGFITDVQIWMFHKGNNLAWHLLKETGLYRRMYWGTLYSQSNIGKMPILSEWNISVHVLKIHVAILSCIYMYKRCFSAEIIYQITAARSKQFFSYSGLSLLNFRQLFQTLVMYMYININN